jgi:hypothetical protein
MDILYVALMVGLFGASWWFVRACAALESAQEERK